MPGNLGGEERYRTLDLNWEVGTHCVGQSPALYYTSVFTLSVPNYISSLCEVVAFDFTQPLQSLLATKMKSGLQNFSNSEL